jgi:hypothetical protein
MNGSRCKTCIHYDEQIDEWSQSDVIYEDERETKHYCFAYDDGDGIPSDIWNDKAIHTKSKDGMVYRKK